jgi:hypothetical protein
MGGATRSSSGTSTLVLRLSYHKYRVLESVRPPITYDPSSIALAAPVVTFKDGLRRLQIKLRRAMDTMAKLPLLLPA